jgi:hypothetical protein
MSPPPVGQKAAAATPISITSPNADGATFTGSASGTVSPSGTAVTAKFWSGGSGAGTLVNGVVTVTGTSWTATFDMTGVPSTTTGFLSAVNTANGAEAHRSNLVWTAPANPGTGGGA